MRRRRPQGDGPERDAEPLPAAASFFERSGLRYATVWVDDVAAVVDRWQAGGGTIVVGPFELVPGTFGAVGADPDGNTVEIMQA